MNAALARRGRPQPAMVSLDEDWQDEEGFRAEHLPDWRPNPEQLYGRSELRDILRQALEQLPDGYSTVFVLRDIEGLSINETASALGLSVPTVKTRLLRARLQLREALSKRFGQRSSPAGRVAGNMTAIPIPNVQPLGEVAKVTPQISEADPR